MTFDDGYRRVHDLAFPVLRKVSEMAAAGIEIASHGSHHRDLTQCAATDLDAELGTSRDRLELALVSPSCDVHLLPRIETFYFRSDRRFALLRRRGLRAGLGGLDLLRRWRRARLVFGRAWRQVIATSYLSPDSIHSHRRTRFACIDGEAAGPSPPCQMTSTPGPEHGRSVPAWLPSVRG